MRLPQGLAAVYILALMPILLACALDQLVEVVSAEAERVTKCAIAGIGPCKLDTTLVASVQPTFEQVADMPAHLRRIGFEHGLDVAHGSRSTRSKCWRAGALQ